MPWCGSFTYEIIRKKVKNVSIRVNAAGEVWVTMPMRGNEKRVREFVEERREWIEEKLLLMGQKVIVHVDEQEWTEQKEAYLTEIFERTFGYFERYGIAYPQLRFRKMVSRYGTCHVQKGSITLNKILADLPGECAEYVAVHELAHLVEANHSRKFYEVVSAVMPEYKIIEKRLHQYALYH